MWFEEGAKSRNSMQEFRFFFLFQNIITLKCIEIHTQNYTKKTKKKKTSIEMHDKIDAGIENGKKHTQYLYSHQRGSFYNFYQHFHDFRFVFDDFFVDIF